MELKRAKVVMLPTKDSTYQVSEGEIFINDSREHNWGKLEALKCERVTKFGHAWNGTGIKTYVNHLYFTTDEEIKEGNWCIVTDVSGTKLVVKCDEIGVMKSIVSSQIAYDSDLARKVIASTDPKLHYSVDYIPNYKDLPSPSQAFIEKYCKLGGIDEVDVEYVFTAEGDGTCTADNNNLPHSSCLCGGNPCYAKAYWELKVNDHNEITIHPIKNSWSRDELQIFKTSDGHNFLSFIRKRMLTMHNENPNYDYMIKLKELEKFVDNNL